jgi:UPF0716 protein FxsA
MRRAGVVALGLLAATIAEIVVFILVVKLIGLPWALAVVLATSILGGWLLRREGTRAWRRFRAALAERRPPGREASDGLLGLLAALLLLLPGFLTDLAGAVLLAPPVRRYAGAALQRVAERRISPAAAGDLFGPRQVRVRPRRDAGDEPVIEGEILDP